MSGSERNFLRVWCCNCCTFLPSVALVGENGRVVTGGGARCEVRAREQTSGAEGGGVQAGLHSMSMRG